MAQKNIVIDEVGRSFPAINGNTTSAITAGDILYASAPSTSPFGTTAPSGVDYDEIEVEPVKFATALTQGKQVVGIAAHDAAAGSEVTVLCEGIFVSPVIDTTGFVGPGRLLRPAEGTTYPGVTNVATTTLPIDSSTGVGATQISNAILTKIGYALTGARADGNYIVWKFSK